MRDGDSEPVPSAEPVEPVEPAKGAPIDAAPSDSAPTHAAPDAAATSDAARSDAATSSAASSGAAASDAAQADAAARAPSAKQWSDGEFRPGDDAVPTHTVEFVRVEGYDALQRYVPGDYIPRGALPAEEPDEELTPGGRASARNGRRRPTPVHALMGMLFWAITVVLFVVGLNLGVDGDYATSRVIAYIAIGTSVVAFLLGTIAVILNRGRELGIVAMVLSVLSNPLVLAELLGWVTGLTS
jgi:hypothetical protein